MNAETLPPAAEDQFKHFLGQGRFMIQRGKTTGTPVFYPRPVAPLTGEELEWVEASGRGTVYSTVTIGRRPPDANYNVALVDLAEGPRMMSRVEGIPPEDVRIGMAVRARIVETEDGPVVVFVPEGAA